MTEKLTNVQQLQDGYIFLIDKPFGWTSFQLVNKVKHLIRHKLGVRKFKIGHAGTLDPLATGLMVVAAGKATKSINELMMVEKRYFATVRLGGTTPSYDLELGVDKVYPYRHITEEQVEDVLESFLGESLQQPPIFSAKKVNGRRAYDYARKGDELELKSNNIYISDIKLVRFDLPIFSFEVTCSKGTYIRSLAYDIGKKLNSGGYLTQLCRLKSGDFDIKDAVTVNQVVDIINNL